MKKQNRTGSRLFFIEFLIVLFFFLIVSAVCLKLFAHAHQITERAEALSRGQAFAASVVEVLEAEAAAEFGDGDSKIAVEFDSAGSEMYVNDELSNTYSALSERLYHVLQEMWPEGSMESDRFVLSYDRTFEICEPENAYYTAVVFIETNPVTDSVESSVTDTDTSDADMAISDGLSTAEIPSPVITIRIADPADEVLYELSVQLHLPLTYKEVLS